MTPQLSLWDYARGFYEHKMRGTAHALTCLIFGHDKGALYSNLGCPTAQVYCGEVCARCKKRFLQIPILTATKAEYLAYHLRKEENDRLDKFHRELRGE